MDKFLSFLLFFSGFNNFFVSVCFFFFIICFHFFDEWGLSDQQGFSPLNYPLLQSTPQVLFVFVILCYFLNRLFGGLSNRLRSNSLCNNLLESTPLVLFIIVF